ncbi:unnamed protein product [Caenorhabditis auriculariae]|uniref:DOT1 domain-containing protein n=1 Tax=Caenorhabditis auriculariae TaxID=2777116 RepID=A0A8S1HNB0_9PELO|nr:unnamed protein product [Caenorhabditis auriculariae]
MEQFELDITSGKCKLKLEDAKRLFRTIALGLEEKNLDENSAFAKPMRPRNPIPGNGPKLDSTVIVSRVPLFTSTLFLYTDEDIDGLVEKGEFSRTYCSACGSRKTQPLQIISHSLNRNEIEFIFTKLMPSDVSQVLDIGSRTGAVLFGASIFSEGKVRGLGVEINEGMVKNCQRHGGKIQFAKC